MKQDLLNRINYFGIETQKRKFGEEADELKEAITEYEMANNSIYNFNFEVLRNHIAEEIVDNLALLRQFQLYYGISDERIIEIFEFKNERTNFRIQNGFYKKDRF